MDRTSRFERHRRSPEPSARTLLAVPNLEHYLAPLYVLGALQTLDDVAFFADKVTLGSMSMRSVRIG